MSCSWWDEYMSGAKGAEDDEILACEWVKSRGNPARVLPKTYAKNRGDRFNHIDKGDLEVIWKEFGATIPRTMGVKGRSLRFTSREDFPYETITVCKVNYWEWVDPKPRGFIMLSKARTHAAIVWSTTFDGWTKRDFVDRRANRGETETLYVCPIRCVQFFNMLEGKDERKQDD